MQLNKKNSSSSLAEIIQLNSYNNIHNKNPKNTTSSNINSSLSQNNIKKPFNKNGLLSKSQLKLASYIEQNKDVTLAGTKRFTDKTGEYYLKNVQLQKKKDKPGPLIKKLSLTRPQNLDNIFSKLHGNINKIKKNATKIITILPENSLTPIPVKEQNSVQGVAQSFNKKQYKNAERVAVFIRRMEYANGVKNHFKSVKKNDEDYLNKIIFIQEWWKTMYKIILIQKCIRGYLFRKNLMKNLEHQEKILKFITSFYHLFFSHLYKKFFDNLKKKYDYINQINSKKIELLEDINEKMEKIEKFKCMKKLKYIVYKWKKKIYKLKIKEKAEIFNSNKNKNKVIKVLRNNYLSKLIKDVLKKDKKEKKELLDKINKEKNLVNILKGIKILKRVVRNNNNKKIFLRLKKLYEFLIKKSCFNKWKKKAQFNNIIQKLKNNKKKKNKLMSIINKLSKIKEIKDKEKMKMMFEIWKNMRIVKQVKKLKIKLIKKEDNNNLNENKNIDNIKKINNNNKNSSENILKENNNKNNDKEDLNSEKNKSFIDDNEEENPKSFKKRISIRHKLKRIKKKKKNNNKNKNGLKKKIAQLKKALLLSIIRLYKKQKLFFIKKYFDIWKQCIKKQITYIKKIISGNTSLNKSKDSKLSDNMNNNNINNNDKILKEVKKDNIIKKENHIEIDSEDDSSVNISRMSGMHLEQEKTENLKPIIYTSQSFIIDQRNINEIKNELPQLNIYKNILHKYPMKMKGDFRKLIEKNSDLLKNKNPRIQITNATCELDQFSPRTKSKTNVNNINILNLNPNININVKNKNYKKKDLKKVVKNCDKDIYEPNKDYLREKQRWISMSIPLDDNDSTKWEFLDSVKGIRKKDNINKFQLIQNYNNNNTRFKLKEMNYERYYKTMNNNKETHLSPIKFAKRENNFKKNNIRDNRVKSYNYRANKINKYDNYDIQELSEESFE